MMIAPLDHRKKTDDGANDTTNKGESYRQVKSQVKS
jgi:hypothetical protein